MSLPRAGWSETDTGTNAEANAVHAAVSGKQFFVTRVQASFSAAPAAGALLQILDGSTTVWEGYVSDINGIDRGVKIPITKGAAATAKLAASGTGGVIGKVNIQGEEF